MLINNIKKAVWYLKDTQDIAMFSSMADARLALALRTSALFYIMLPFIGFLLTIIAGINAYNLHKSGNKNLDLWLEFISSTLSAGLASISLYGTALSVVMSFSFPAGPWFFFGSLSVGLIQQSIMMGVNFSRAFSAPKDSVQRMHYLQTALKNIYGITVMTAAISTVVLVMLFPTAAPIAGMVSAASVAALTVFGIQWRILPSNWKRSIKGLFHIGKPELIQNTEPGDINNIKDRSLVTTPRHYNRLFQFDYSEKVREMDAATAADYLNCLILKKIETYSKAAVEDSKSRDKRGVLEYLSDVLKNPSKSRSKKNLLNTYPLAFQSFWVEKSEVEQLFDAVTVSFEKRQVCDETDTLLSHEPFFSSGKS